MKRVKVAFTDWKGGTLNQGYSGNIESSFVYKALSKNYDVEISTEPDYVFSIPFGYEFTKYPRSVRILCSWENVKPNFNIYDYAITMFPGYQYRGRHLYYDANCFFDEKAAEVHDASIIKHLNIPDDLAKRDQFCAFVVSNGKGRKEREDFFHQLSKYKKVNSGGRFLNNIGGTVTDKIEFMSRHKFTITFENNLYYTTEKLQDGFAARTVPIYWGDPFVTEIYNPKAFINCHDYGSFDEVIDRIRQVDKDDELYLSMLREPAFLKPRTSQEFFEDLEKFVIKIVETPVDLAIQRDTVMHPAWQERIAYYGWKKFVRHWEAASTLARVLRPFTNTRIAAKAKEILMGDKR